MYRNRGAVVAAALLAPVLVLVLWFVTAQTNRCVFYQNLGFVYLAKGALAGRSHFNTAERLFSSPFLARCGRPVASFGLGQSYAGLGRATSAVAALRRGEERSGLRRFLIGGLYEQMGRPADAWREYRQLPLDAASHFHALGARAEKRGDYHAALRYFSVARAINPAAAKAYYGAAFVYWRRLDDEARAMAMIRRALAVDTRPSVERDFYQGLLCYYEEQTGCAFAAWVSAVRQTARADASADTQYLAYEMLSRVLTEQGRAQTKQLAALDRGLEAR